MTTPSGAPETTEPGAIVFLPEDVTGFTEDELYSLFSSSGDLVTLNEVVAVNPTAFTAGANRKFHLPGKHDQHSHGHGQGEYHAGSDIATPETAGLIISRTGGYTASQSAYPPLSVVAAEQGFDGHPSVVSPTALDIAVMQGAIEMRRGTMPSSAQSAAANNEQFRSGEAYFGRGIYGNGYYFASGAKASTAADSYSDGTKGSTMRAALRKEAKIVGYEQIEQEHADFLGANPGRAMAFADVGTYAAARGFDAIVKQVGSDDWFIVVLNRTAVLVEAAA